MTQNADSVTVGRVWVEDHDWRLATDEAGGCRWGSPKRGYCGEPAVAELRRGNQWWSYCDGHLYGRRIRNGRICVQVSVGSLAEERGWIGEDM